MPTDDLIHFYGFEFGDGGGEGARNYQGATAALKSDVTATE